MIKPQGVFRKPMDESTGEAESRKKKSDGIDKEKAKKTKGKSETSVFVERIVIEVADANGYNRDGSKE